MLQKSIKTEHIKSSIVNTGQKSKKYRQNITLLYAMKIFASIHFFGSVLIPFFEEYGGLNFAQTMILESIFMGGIFLMEIPTGTIADKYSRKLSLNLSFVVNIIAVGVYVIKPSFWFFALGEIIWAVAIALHSGAYDALLYDTLVEIGEEETSQKHYARMHSMGLIAMSLGSISGGFIAKYFGLRATMVYSAVPLMITFLLSLRLKEPETHNLSKDKKPWQIFKQGFHHIKGSKALQRIIGDMVIIAMIGYFGIWLYQKRLGDIGMDIKYFGLVQTSSIILQVIIMNLSKPLEKLFHSKKKVLTFSAVSVGLGFLITGFSTNILISAIGFVIAISFGMTYRIPSMNYMNKHIPSDQRATILSTASMFRQCAIMMTNPLLGFGVEWNVTVILLILGLIGCGWAVISPLQESDLLD
jgi:MFS family permease